MLLMIRAFSTRHPAMAFIPDVRLICHWLLFTSLCPPAVQPLEIHGRSDVQNHQRVRTRLPAANDTPLDDSSYCSPSLPGAWSVFGVVEIVLCYNNAVRQKPQRIDLYRAGAGHNCAYCASIPPIASAIFYMAPSRRAAQYSAVLASTASPRRIYAAAPCTARGARSFDMFFVCIVV